MVPLTVGAFVNLPRTVPGAQLRPHLQFRDLFQHGHMCPLGSRPVPMGELDQDRGSGLSLSYQVTANPRQPSGQLSPILAWEYSLQFPTWRPGLLLTGSTTVAIQPTFRAPK